MQNFFSKGKKGIKEGAEKNQTDEIAQRKTMKKTNVKIFSVNTTLYYTDITFCAANSFH